MRPPKKYPVCAKFRDWYVVIHRPTLVENLLQYGYPHLVPWLQLLVPASPAEPATLHLYLHLDFKSTVQPIDVWRYDVAADIGFECERPRVAVDGYTLIDGCVLTNVETEETIALIERVRLSLKKLITEESMKDPRVMTAILRTWQLRARATGCTDG
jgi:hypothetical protein